MSKSNPNPASKSNPGSKSNLDFERRPDGKYNVWQSRTLVELGELTEKKAYNIYTKYSVDVPSRWMLIDVVDQPENSLNAT